jgi:hypothetical protein
MWFAAMSGPGDHAWFEVLLERLLEGDRATLSLFASNPFPDHPPRFVRATHYIYRFTTPAERKATGRWWEREYVGAYYPVVRLK